VNKRKLLSLLLLIKFLILLLVLAGCGGKPAVKVENAFLNPSRMGEGVYSGFMEIYNTGSADSLLSFTVQEYPEATFELHDVKDGKMTEVESIKIPASSKIDLKRGSLHLMMFSMPGVTEMPEVVTLLLDFEKNGEIAIQARVEVPAEPAEQGSMPEMNKMNESKH
jgi:copper(I)-binding protein